MKHIPRKRFGQNFLTDQAVLHDIITAIDPQADDSMVEIGPGLAAMTRLLLQRLRQLHVVELDRDLVARLNKDFDPAHLIVHAGDALKFDFSTIPVALRSKVAGGRQPAVQHFQPFVISSGADRAAGARSAFHLQKEVVERMVAEPGSKTYGRLSVMLQWHYQMELMFVAPPTAFDPPPKVERRSCA